MNVFPKQVYLVNRNFLSTSLSRCFQILLFPFFLVLQSHKVSSKSDQKQKIFIPRTFFVNKQLALFFNYLKKGSLNFAQNFRECSFNLAGSESVEKSRSAQLFAYISQLFVYKTRLWTQLRTRSRYSNVRPVYTFVFISWSFHTVEFFFQASCLFTKSHKCIQKIIRHFYNPSIFTFMNF